MGHEKGKKTEIERKATQKQSQQNWWNKQFLFQNKVFS